MSSYQVSTNFARFKSFDVSNAPESNATSWYKIIIIATVALTIIGMTLLVCSATIASSPLVSIAGAIIFDLGWPIMIASGIALAVQSYNKKIKEQKKLSAKKDPSLLDSAVLTANNNSEKKTPHITVPPKDKSDPLFMKESTTIILENISDLDH
ncbi:hypothetical protein CLAVI_000013 [Candidatus Clavichlamydia salmonicola]|uniref:hypothetical protein n=1 Tax=Candidatus Clavichlamydia salmonicola TaxID=469812 RepID=UPI001890CF5E|nr:hypothetical protein [Candidatus Clavichlamydia salmonicola]MBF5050412.1 hypothetical protein [Candidatus Clavichlamydia salmonicola]